MHVAQPRRIVLISAAIMSLMGAGFIISYWIAHDNLANGAVRAILFVAIIGAVHAIGYRLYVGQNSSSPPSADGISSNRENADMEQMHQAAARNVIISPEFIRPIATGFLIQAIVLVFALLLLDTGHLLRVWQFAMICQVATVGMILIRRRKSPTQADLDLIRYGIVIYMFVGQAIGVIW